MSQTCDICLAIALPPASSAELGNDSRGEHVDSQLSASQPIRDLERSHAVERKYARRFIREFKVMSITSPDGLVVRILVSAYKDSGGVGSNSTRGCFFVSSFSFSALTSQRTCGRRHYDV